MVKIALFVDNSRDLDVLVSCMHSWADDNGYSDIEPTYFGNPDEMKAKIEAGADYDIYVLHVIQEGENGSDLGGFIRTKSDTAPIIYIAENGNFAYSAYQLNALRYITKPVSSEKLMEALDFAFVVYNVSSERHIAVKNAKTISRLDSSDIMYIENEVRLMHFYMSDGTVNHGSRRSESFESAMQPLLKTGRYVQTHKSYIINLKFVKEIKKTVVIMENSTVIPISRKHMGNIEKAYEAYVSHGFIG